ncbi:MAG: T9SS type A sorting domain-containing protein [Bacteroidota bacterium]
MPSRFTSGRRLAAYSAAAGLSLAATRADAQIIYADVDPDVTVDQSEFSIDFDGDGTDDLTLRHRKRVEDFGTPSSSMPYTYLTADVRGNASFLGTPGITGGSISALNSGASISAGQTFYPDGVLAQYDGVVLVTYGLWGGRNNRYLGVRFTAGTVTKQATTHYAWVRLDVANQGNDYRITVKDYAYESTPDAPIQAGATPPLPVELTDFDVAVRDQNAQLTWATLSETDNAGFEVQARRQNERNFRTMGFVGGAGTTTETRAYTFEIGDLIPGRYQFRLRQIDFDGSFAFSDAVEAAVSVPGTHFLGSAYPNPFNPTAQFELAVPTAQTARVTLHDAQGREVQELFAGSLAANATQTIRIDATGLPSGLYLYRATGDRFTDSRTIVLAK